MADESTPSNANNMIISRSSLSQMMSSGNLENFDEQIMSDLFRSSSSRMFSSSISSTTFFRTMEETPDNSPEKKRAATRVLQPAAPQLLSNADLPEDHDGLMTTMITKSFQKHMSISSAEESSSSDEVEVIEVRKPVRLPQKACSNYPETVVTATTAGSGTTISQAPTIQENEVLHDSITTAPDTESMHPKQQQQLTRGSAANSEGPVEILNLDYLARVLLPGKKREPRRAVNNNDLAVLAPDPIAPGLCRDDSFQLGNDSSFGATGTCQQQQQEFSGEESLRFGESMSMLMPDRHAPCAVVTPSHPKHHSRHAPLDQDTLMSRKSFPGLDTNAVSYLPQGQPSPPRAFHSSMPCSLENNTGIPVQQTSPRSFHSSMPCTSNALDGSSSSLQQTSPRSFHSSLPCSLNHADLSMQQQQQMTPFSSTLAPPPPTLGSHSPMRSPSLNLSNSSLQPGYSNDNTAAQHHSTNAIEGNPEYLAAAERLTRSMQRSMNSRINVKQNGGIVQGYPGMMSFAADKGDDYSQQQMQDSQQQPDGFFRMMPRDAQL